MPYARSVYGSLDDQHLDPEIAANYDERHAERFAPDVLTPMVDTLADLAGERPALELAVGTGRVALSLAARGVEMHGIDFSEPMLAELRAKPDADQVSITFGDMSAATCETRPPGDFGLVYLVYNTIGNVTSQDGQVACFANAARHLGPGGRFVIEVLVPELASVPPGETRYIFGQDENYLGFDDYDDPVNQTFTSNHWHMGDTPHIVRGRFRFVWPSELDLMAKLAGMELESRWADWDQSPFTSQSKGHVSVWRKRESYR